jgi:hypothetical protein
LLQLDPVSLNERQALRKPSFRGGAFLMRSRIRPRMYSPTTGKTRLGYRPSKKSIKRMVEKVPRRMRNVPTADLCRRRA